jgi:hypothetical protein
MSRVGYPEPNVWYDLRVYLHLPQLEDEVWTRLRRRARESEQAWDTSSRTIGAYRGIWLTLEPRVEGVRFNPVSQEVAWFEDLQEVAFRFLVEAVPEGRDRLGALDVRADGLLIGQVPLAMSVGGGPPGGASEGDGDRRFTAGRPISHGRGAPWRGSGQPPARRAPVGCRRCGRVGTSA